MNKVLERVLGELDGLPDDEQARIAGVLKAELRSARRRPRREPGRWARVADRLAALNALEDESERLVDGVRAFRDGFGLGERPLR